MPATTAPVAGPVTLQGITVPSAVTNDPLFFGLTRRNRLREGSVKQYNSASSTQDVWELQKSGILSGILLRFVGSLVVTPGTGTVASTRRWPYDLIRAKFTANGQSNVINASGLKLKARDVMRRIVDDRGVTQTIGTGTVSQGTLSTDAESWGVGSGASGLAAGTYDVDIFWWVPVAEDGKDLTGSIFMATSSADMTLSLEYANIASLFTLTGNATAALTGSFSINPEKFTIPVNNGALILPEGISMFHSLVQNNSSAISNGDNIQPIVGQGPGQSLLRMFYQVWNGSPTAPLMQNAANFGPQSWQYGTSQVPDNYPDGQTFRYFNSRAYNNDVGGAWGFASHEFAEDGVEFRDVVQEQNTGDLRLFINLPSGLTIASPTLEWVTETVFYAGQVA